MGFDNECILNIQSLAGEYFCPVCRLLVYPNEAMQSQCTHLYCKPCLTYVVGTTRACPYDGYLVTEADSKPLTESNKALADTIGKIAVHCLYHRSGCTWQGQLSECTTHCAGCAFGNSPVVCNRCGTQIVHRQVQEHAQNCPGAQPQTQQAEGSQDATGATTAAATATTEQNQATLQAGAPVSQANTAQVVVAPSSAQNATQVQPSSLPQAVPTQEQLYQQQFQQYYQQYPGYDPYQQPYQHYDPYQQQVYQQQQMQAHIPQAVQGQQPQVYMQAQSQPHQQPQPQLQSQTPIRPQSQPQPQTPIASQPQMQAQVNTHQQLQFAQPHPQMTPQTHPQLQGHQQPQVYPQPHPNVQPPSSQHQVQSHLQPRPQVPQHQQPHPQVQHPHPHTQPHPLPQPQHHSNVQPQPPSQSQPQVQPQTQPQPQTQAQPHAHPQAQPPPQPLLQAQHPPVHAVTGHQSYPQVHQQMPLGMVQQHPVHMHPQMQVGPQQLPQDTVQMQGQFPLQQLPHKRPPQSHAPMQQQQQPAMFPPQGQRPNMPPSQLLLHPHPHPTSQPIHQHPDMLPSHQQNVAQQQVHGHLVHSQVFPGQAPGLGHTQPPQPNLYMQQQGVQSLPRPQGSAFTLPHAHRQLQQNVPISRGLPHQSQSVAGPPVLSNHAVAHQPFQMPSNGLAHAKLMPSSAVQPYPIRTNLRPQSSALPTSPVPQSGAKAQVSSNMKPELQAEAATQKTDTKDAQGVDLVTTRAENELKSVEGEKSISEDKGKSSHLESDDKEISESSHALEKDPVEKTDEPVIKQMVKDEATTKLDPSTAAKDRDGVLQIKQDHEEPQGQADVHKKLLSQQAEILDGKVQKDVADQQLAHSVSGAVAPSQTVGTSHSVLQNVNLQDRNLFNHQFPHQGIGQMHSSSFPRPGQAVSLPDNQQLSGPPHMLDRNQRPPGPDQMLLPSMAPPHQMQVPGQLSAHMRPQGHNLIPPQGNPSIPPGHFQQPIGKQLPGSFGPSVGSHNQGHMPPPHVAGHRRPSESISGPLFGGPPPGAFDSQGGIMSRGPPHGSEGQQIPGNPMDAELLANGRVGYFDGRQSDSHLPGPRERVPFGQSSSIQAATLKTNGGPGKGVSGGLHDPLFPYLPEERFKSFPLDPGRHIIDRRDFQEDLKQFPRPSHLEGEPGSKFDSFFSSSRPLGLHLHGSAGAGTSRLRPPFQTGGSGPMGVHDDFLRSASDSSRVRMDGLLPIRSPGREFPGIPSSRFLHQEDIEGRGLESRLFGDRSKPLSFPSDGGAFHESRFPMLPSHMHRGDPDGPGSLRISEPIGSSPLPIHLRAGEPLGLRAGLGAFPNHLRSGDVGGPGNLPLNLRIGESIGGHFQPGFGGSIPVHGYPNDGGFFNAGDDRSRKRKAGSMGWCRICKVDCETVEGLDLHSQTRDHQKKAMDMVLNIKKDNAKKQKISFDDNAPHEDTNKSRKASFESRGN